MFTTFTKLVRQSKLDQAKALPILRCIEYIELHLHEVIHLSDLLSILVIQVIIFQNCLKNE